MVLAVIIVLLTGWLLLSIAMQTEGTQKRDSINAPGGVIEEVETEEMVEISVDIIDPSQEISVTVGE